MPNTIRNPLEKIDPGRSAERGFVIAFIGADGSGKSTVHRAICEWLRTRTTDVESIYFGSGDGPMSLSRRLLAMLGRLRHRIRAAVRRKSQKRAQCADNDDNRSNQVVTGKSPARLRFVLDSLLIACERRKSIKRMLRARSRGAIVVTDRYPQTNSPGTTDCPRLNQWRTHRSLVLRKLAEWERTIYDLAEMNPSDAVVKLQVSPAVATQRVTNHSVESIKQRIDWIERLRFPSGTEVISIDADQPLDVVLSKTKAALERVLAE